MRGTYELPHYIYECLKLSIKHRPYCSREALSRWYSDWAHSLQSGGNRFVDRRPWINFDAVASLEKSVSYTSRVFEFGCGGATLFFADRVRELVSVEHDPEWFRCVQAEMGGRTQARWIPHLVSPSPSAVSALHLASDPDAYVSAEVRFSGCAFRDYAATIDTYQDHSFDLVLIDGRARPSCFKHALHKLKFGGTIVLNNAERPQYASIDMAARALGFEIQEFWGPAPYQRHFSRVLLMRKVQRYFALNDLDKKLEQYLNFDGGVFVEAGANDGVKQSNTLHFEACRGWHGLLVEPLPELARKCRLHRPRSIVEAVALVAPMEAGKSVTLRYADLMSVIKGGMKTAEEEEQHVKAGIQVQALSNTFEMEVPSATLSGLLDKHGISQVHLLSLDLEGYERKALEGLDLSRHRPQFILVEARYRKEIEQYLAPYYELKEELSHHDLLFQSREHVRSGTQ